MTDIREFMTDWEPGNMAAMRVWSQRRKESLRGTATPGGFPAEPRIDMTALEGNIALITAAGLYPADVPVAELVDLSFAAEGAVR